FFVKINGKDRKVKAVPGSYLTLNRKWRDGDTVELRMPFKFYLEPVMDQQNIASLFYGPVLLAAQESEPRTEWRKVTLDAEDISRSISGDPGQLQFSIDGVVFKPFYETYGRHSVYLDIVLR
ncbi:MAG: glycoside hydrolase family 127 protein, partial [Bacteroidales bacterium]|nr:glycoside hydrolase family 127 protein [Bacteroidales bacterium]